MPSKNVKKEQTNTYIMAGLAVLGLGLLSTTIGYSLFDPANLWLVYLGDLVALGGLLLMTVSISANKRAASGTKKKK